MTLVLKLDIDIVKMYHHGMNVVSISKHSKVTARTDTQTRRQMHRHTHRQYENTVFPDTQAVKITTDKMGFCSLHALNVL